MMRLLLSLLGLGLTATLPRAEPPASLPKEVEAILHKRCGECHGDKAPKGRLTLTTPAGLAQGGRKGIVVRPGKPDDSLLWHKVPQ